MTAMKAKGARVKTRKGQRPLSTHAYATGITGSRCLSTLPIVPVTSRSL
jgi:hypothetical protein